MRWNRLLKVMLLCLFVGCTSSLIGQEREYCLTESELWFAENINALRSEHGLTPLPYSLSLTIVAKTHVEDLSHNHPDTSFCSTASWSDKGSWTPCCYNKFIAERDCMWNKPKELTKYRYRGYELSYYQDYTIDIRELFQLWKNTPEVVDMIVCKGKYKTFNWKTMGLCIGDNYVSVWFGQVADGAGKPDYCKPDSNYSDIDTLSHNVETEASSADSIASIHNDKASFYVIIASSTNKEEALKMRATEENKCSCKLLLIEKDNKYRVAIEGCQTIEEAREKKKIYSSTYHDCWIMEVSHNDKFIE